MITLITGVPGSGKSLWAIKLIKQYLAEGRAVYADIDGINMDGVLPAPDDWRDTPDGSVVVYDECQQRFGPDGRGRSGRDDISALEVHRHTGHDIIFITQRERLIHAHIRDLVGKHYHVQRIFGSHNAKIFTRDECINTKSTSALNACDFQTWPYDKSLFECYKSATIHTHKRTLPRWLIKSVSAIAIMAVLLVGFIYKSSSFWTGNTGLIAQAADLDLPDRHDSDQLIVTVSKSAHLPLSGCVIHADATQCMCIDTHGHKVMDMTFQQCYERASDSILSFRAQESYAGMPIDRRSRPEPPATKPITVQLQASH